jgi:hypothetical protein
MPARDKYHDTVKQVLIKDRWTITHDPFMLRAGLRDLYIDLGAERLLAAEKRRGQNRGRGREFCRPVRNLHFLKEANVRPPG